MLARRGWHAPDALDPPAAGRSAVGQSQLAGVLACGLRGGLEGDPAVLTVVLGLVEGEVGVAEELIGRGALPVGDPDAGRSPRGRGHGPAACRWSGVAMVWQTRSATSSTPTEPSSLGYEATRQRLL